MRYLPAFVLWTFATLSGLFAPVDAWALSLYHPPFREVAETLVLFGQRFVVFPAALLLTIWLSYRRRSPAPLLLLCGAFLLENLLVGGVKLLLGRVSPLSGEDLFFAGGMLYPSGHAANVVVLWGLSLHLLVAAGLIAARFAAGVLALLLLVVSASSLVLATHWFTDLVAGMLLGALVLSVSLACGRLLASRPVGVLSSV